jgi:hypothetical protein
VPNINDAFPSPYLKAGDLQGREVTVTIIKVGFEAVGQEREMKAILYFAGKQKGVVLNKTNARKITEIAGSAVTEDWRGVQVALYPTETEFGGKMVDCIRVKAVGKAALRPSPAPKPAPVPEPVIQIHDDDIPF